MAGSMPRWTSPTSTRTACPAGGGRGHHALHRELERRPRRSAVGSVTNRAIMHGSRTTTIQAPWVNFVSPMITATTPVASGARPVEQGAERPAGSPVPEPVAHHAGLREREGDEHAQRVERDQRVRVPLEEHQEPDRQERQDDDAVREGEPVPAVRELAGHEPVPREERGEPREVREARVGRQDEDQHRHALDEVVDAATPRRRAGRAGSSPSRPSTGTTPKACARAEMPRNSTMRMPPSASSTRRAVWASGGPEGGHAVGDGLDPGHRGAPGREGPEDQEGGQHLAAAGRRAEAPRHRSPRGATGARPSRSAGRRRRETGRSAARRAGPIRARRGGSRSR